ncbi:hypothetical protein FAGKG844_530018 [Frankia sp. AgKG'84/4]
MTTPLRLRHGDAAGGGPVAQGPPAASAIFGRLLTILAFPAGRDRRRGSVTQPTRAHRRPATGPRSPSRFT